MPYLDFAASAPLRADAMLALLPYLADEYANPSGTHSMARAAKNAIEEQRERIATALGFRPLEVTFTSGGTESDNLAVFGAARAARAAGLGNGIVTTAIEHKAVLAPVRRLADEGFRCTEVGCDASGVVTADALADALDEHTVLVSVMLANNEVGTVQPLPAIVAAVRERAPYAVVHTDAVQAVPWLDVAAHAQGVDMVSISAHKFGGPKGIGALLVREGTALVPLVEGGGQERGLRAGTLNTAGIVGMGNALIETHTARADEVARIGALRDRFMDALLQLPGTWVNGTNDAKVAGSCNVGFEGIAAESLLFLLDRSGVYASAGSACSSGAIEPSHVLTAMGLSAERARSCVRFSLGFPTTSEDIDAAIEAVTAAVQQLRSAPVAAS